MSDYNPHSPDAMFATILQRLNERDKVDQEFREEVRERFDEGTMRMRRIEEQTTKTNGRVTRLEGNRKILAAKLAGAVLAGAGIIKLLLWLHENGWLAVG